MFHILMTTASSLTPQATLCPTPSIIKSTGTIGDCLEFTFTASIECNFAAEWVEKMGLSVIMMMKPVKRKCVN